MERYSPTAVALHWTTALVIAAMLGAGLWMTGQPAASPGRLLATQAHVLGGFLVPALMLARLFGLLQEEPVSPLPLSKLVRAGARAVHGLLYLALFALAASGALLLTLGEGLGAWLVGQLDHAPSLGGSPARTAHEALARVYLLLLVVHVGGVVFQHVRRGGVLQRMGLPFPARGGPGEG